MGVLSQLHLLKDNADKQAALVQHDPCRDKITPLLFSWCRWAGRLLGLENAFAASSSQEQHQQTSSPRAARSMSGQKYPITFFVVSLGSSPGLKSNRSAPWVSFHSFFCPGFMPTNKQPSRNTIHVRTKLPHYLFGGVAGFGRCMPNRTPFTFIACQFARVVKGVDLRSTAGNCAWVRTPQLTPAAAPSCGCPTIWCGCHRVTGVST